MDEFVHISDYFNGLLSSEEAARFDRKIQEDPVFADEVAFYVQAMQQLKNQVAEEKKARFMELYQSGKSGRIAFLPVRKIWFIVSAAAVIAALIIGWWFYQSAAKNSGLQMADNYVTTELRTMRVEMGNKDSLQQARDLYNDGKFSASLQQFESILERKPGNAELLKDAGIVSLRSQQYDKALAYFTELEQITLEFNPGKFYHALTLMKRNQQGDASEAKKLLQEVVQNDLEGKKTAQKWLKNL